MSYNFRYLLLTCFTFICIRARGRVCAPMRASVCACVYVCGRARAGIIIYPDPFSSFAGLPGLDLCTWFRYPAPFSFLCFCVFFCF